MKQGLLLTVAVVLILAGAVTSWWSTPAPDEYGALRRAATLVTRAECVEYLNGERACQFSDDASTIGSARRWTFLVGMVASALLIAAHAAPGGTRARRGLGVAAIVGSAFALVAGLGMLCTFIWLATQARLGYPGMGGILFVAGAVLGLRSSRVVAAADPPA
jgi:hypothetical protein